FGEQFALLFANPPASVGLGMFLAALGLGPGKEALKAAFQSRQSIPDAQLNRLQVQASVRQIAEQAGPQIGSFAIAHLQSQDLEAFVFFAHPQHRTEALPTHVPVDAHQKVGPVHVKKLVTLALQRTTPPGFQFRGGSPNDARSLLGVVLMPRLLPRNPRYDPGRPSPPKPFRPEGRAP